MKNKIISSIVALGLATSLQATSFFIKDGNSHYDQFHNEIVKLFKNDNFFQYSSYAKMNVFNNSDNYTFLFSVPGMDKKDMTVTINNQNVLTVAGEKKELSQKEKENMIRQEHNYGVFSRSISLPDDIDSDSIKVTYKNGILHVVVAKDMEKLKKEIREVTID